MAVSPPPRGAPYRDVTTKDLDLFTKLSNYPTIPINIPTTTTSLALIGRACILAGWSLRETTGTADMQCEFIDGQNASGNVAGEQTIPAPLPGSVGDSFVDIDKSSSGGAQANNVTIAGVAGATTFITGFEITGDGATAAGIITVTLTGILGGTKTYILNIPLGATAGLTPFIIEFARPIPASGLNTAIVVNVPSFGSGNTQAAVTAHGYQLTLGSSVNNTGQSATADCGEPGVFCRSGLYLRMIAGSVVGTAWVRM